MKRNVFLPVSLLVLGFIAGCSHKIELVDFATEAPFDSEDSQISVLFQAPADTASVTVQSNGKWTIEATNDRASSWLTYSPESGGKGDTRVKIDVSANEEPEERSAVLHFRNGKEERTIHVVQKPDKAFLVSSEKAEFGPAGGAFNVVVTSNVDYTLTIMDAPWLHQVFTKGVEETLSFQVDPNDRADKRQGSLVFVSELGTETVTVYQTGVNPQMILSANEVDVPSEGGRVRVDVSSNFNVEYTITTDWVYEIKTRSLSTNTFSFYVERNPEFDGRTAEIVFRNADNNLSETVTIRQAQQDAIIPAVTELSLDYKEQAFTLPLSANVDISVSVSSDWIGTSSTRGLETRELQFYVSENTTKQERESTILITSGTMKQSIGVKQLPTTSKPHGRQELIESFRMTQGISEQTRQIPELGEKNQVTGEWDTKTIVEKLLTLDDVIHAVPDKSGKNIYVMQRDSCIFPIVLEWDDGFDDEDTESVSPSSSQNGSAIRTRSAVSRGPQKKVSPDGSGKKVLILSPYQGSHKIGGEQEGNMRLNIDFVTENLNNAGYHNINYKHDNEVTLEHFDGDLWLEHDLVLLRTHGGLWYSDYLKDPTTNQWKLDAHGDPIGISGPYTVFAIGESRDMSFLDTMDEEVASSLRRYLDNNVGSVGISVGREWFETTMTDPALFPHSILIPLSCHSFETWESNLGVAVDAVQNAFHGLISYCGFVGSIDRSVATATMHSLVRSLSRGMSFADAVTYLRSDTEWVDIWYVSPPYSDLFRFATLEDAFLIDPRPRNLRSTVKNNLVTFNWDCDFPSGKYEYLVVFDGVEHPLQPLLPHSLSVPMTKTGSFPWSVKVNIYTETNKPKLIASYQTEGTPFTIDNTISLFTDKAADIGIRMATVTAHFEADFDVDVQEQGVVYSSTNTEPTVIGSDCRKQVAEAVSNPFHSILTGLEPLTKYYARSYMIVGKDEMCQIYYGNVIDFTTDPIKNVIPDDIMDKLDDIIPIYDGVNPPNIEGQYLLSPCVLTYDSTGGFSPGDEFNDCYIQFSNQDMENNTLDYREQETSSSSVGLGAFISGEGDTFSVFFNTEGVDEYSDYSITFKTALIISGILTENGIKDMDYAFVLVEKSDDPKPHLIPVGSFRSFKDGDGLSVPVNYFQSPSRASGKGFIYPSSYPGMLEAGVR